MVSVQPIYQSCFMPLNPLEPSGLMTVAFLIFTAVICIQQDLCCCRVLGPLLVLIGFGVLGLYPAEI